MAINGKASKVMVYLPFNEVLEILKEKINELKYHLFVRNEQYKIYNNLKLQMPENAILMHVDYAENYENKQQGECQLTYFGFTSFSIFTSAAYIRLNGKTQRITIVIISEV